jgi:RNA polymerase sigma factor (sigma-70 family)
MSSTAVDFVATSRLLPEPNVRPASRRHPRKRRPKAESHVSSILERIGEGDALAVQECIDQYGGLVWSVARRLLGNHSEAEDAVQDVFVELWKSAERFDPKLSSEKSFVVMVARRRIIDRLRRYTRRIDTHSVEDDLVEPASDEHHDIERSAEATMAARALEDLPEARRQVLELSIYQGMSHSEIADAIDMPIGTVKSHITRGLAAVREVLLSGDDGGS